MKYKVLLYLFLVIITIYKVCMATSREKTDFLKKHINLKQLILKPFYF